LASRWLVLTATHKPFLSASLIHPACCASATHAPETPKQVTCSPDEDPSTYDGYQIALWRRIATEMGWTSADSDWTFSCLDWSPMLEDLMAPDGLCTLAAAGALAGREGGWLRVLLVVACCMRASRGSRHLAVVCNLASTPTTSQC